MERTFEKIIRPLCWQPTTRVLVAVSGGVDSMVLLRLLQRLPTKMRPHIGVAHFNHQLRPESVQEQQGIQTYCQTYHLDYYTETWNEPVERNLEQMARTARYNFLFDVYKKNHYDVLLTAHHADDQAETILMKLIKGSLLRNFEGIRFESQREQVKIIRPLHGFSKEDIERFAVEHDLSFWEDKSNQSEAYLRNRIRHHVLPVLKSENPDYAQKIGQFTKEVALANQALEELLKPKLDNMVIQEEGQQKLILDLFLKESKAVQYQLLLLFTQKNLIDKGGTLTQQQLTEIQQGFERVGNKRYSLAKNWWANKNYGKFNYLNVHKKTMSRSFSSLLIKSEGNYCFGDEELFILSEKIREEHPVEIRQTLEIPASRLPLTVRTYQEGDYFILDKSGQKKKVSRYFIDQKVSLEKRRTIPLVVDNENNVLWIVGFRKSYLSITDETDKIFYKLTYYG